MRTSGVVIAIAGFLIVGSVVNADFFITSTRRQNAFTLNSQTYDIVDFTVTDTVKNGTNGFINQIDLAMVDTTGGGKNGMLISASAQTIAHQSRPGYPDLFNQFGEASLPHTSWLQSKILGDTSGQILNLGGSTVGMFYGTTFTYDQAANNGIFANQYTDQQLVGAISADETWTSGNGFTANGAPVMFAQAAVQSGDAVTLVTPSTTNGRTMPSTAWETGGTVFGADGTSSVFANTGASTSPNPTGTGVGAYTNAVPEPASIGFLGLAAGGLLARRRRQA